MVICDKYDGKNIIIYGLGKSGLSTYEALKETSANLFLWDDDVLIRDKLTKKGIIFSNDNDWPWNKMDFLIPSPGIQVSNKNKSPIIKKSLENNKIKIIGDFEIFFQNHKNNKSKDKIITVTGTNGKSTFVSILKDILETDGRNVSLAGNIGVPILSQKESNQEKIYIFEVSSFQIELFNEFRSDIAVLLNISNDHTDRYNSFDEYKKTKLKIFSNLESDDFAILNNSLSYKNSISKINPLPEKVIINNEEFFNNNSFDLPNFS
ncbi:MAG: Mur ligase family protein, partial [Pseudomonadota bacterium]|nr:Mur ligase family protein [Pseudomonadota bacterium]